MDWEEAEEHRMEWEEAGEHRMEWKEEGEHEMEWEEASGAATPAATQEANPEQRQWGAVVV